MLLYLIVTLKKIKYFSFMEISAIKERLSLSEVLKHYNLAPKNKQFIYGIESKENPFQKRSS
ncbi:hypothetical protein ATE47_09400 [Chryseobacterium sp. IHB B 17019]|nr:hypothetical protein ATE47_09400 [Chryseobacterium sp. IHB B 17019]